MLAHQCAEHISHQVGLIIDNVRSTDVAVAPFIVGTPELDLMFYCQWDRRRLSMTREFLYSRHPLEFAHRSNGHSHWLSWVSGRASMDLR
jgi:hypothetical protein